MYLFKTRLSKVFKETFMSLINQSKLIVWLHWVIHYLWGKKKYALTHALILIHVENLYMSIFSLTFDSDGVVSREATMNETTALQLSAAAGIWLIHGCKILICKNICILRKIMFTAISTDKLFLIK